MTLMSCGTKKNTALTRTVQGFKARYNTYFNGNEAFKQGRAAQEEGNTDNFTEIIPLYVTGNAATLKTGTSNFNRAIEKSQKTIKLHSITKRPEWKKSRAKTEADRIWLSQKEYNPFLWRAWFLMGEAQFRKGEYMEAASTFAYIQRLYPSFPDRMAKARLLEARCYAEMDWLFDAEQKLTEVSRDSFPTGLAPLRASVEGDIQLRRKQYAEAIVSIEAALKGERRSLPRTRMYLLLGQLHHQVGNNDEAYRYYKKVTRRNPPYELDFNARILMTETLPKGKSKQTIRKLKAMARETKNANYLDQVHYAIGNIYLAEGDTTRAIWAYEDGVREGTRNGVEKGVLLFHLGRLYWDREKFVDAHRCYSQAVGLLDKDHDDYAEVNERSRTLDELLPHATAVELQDSLQAMARMDSAALMKKIDQMIEWRKKQDRENERKEEEAQQAATNASRPGRVARPANASALYPAQTVWYFYNPTTVASGKTEFERKWGKRELADDWRRANKTVLGDFNEEELSDSLVAVMDSIAAVEDSVRAVERNMTREEKDSVKEAEYAQDPYRPEFYLKDIPLTPEQMEASNAGLVEGLFNSAIIYKDGMGNLPLAERTFKRILVDFAGYPRTDEIYYNLFQLYSRDGRPDAAETYRLKLIDEFPENEHAKLVADPDFEYKVRYGKQIEDSVYTLAYDAFRLADYPAVIRHSEVMAAQYPDGANRPRFMFLEAMSRLEMGDRDRFMGDLRALVEKYPKEKISELAGLYVKGLREGRILQGGTLAPDGLWERRIVGGEEGDSLAADTTFSVEKDTEFVFVIAYQSDSVHVNQLLYEMARYNFTAFSVRNFDLSIEPGAGIDMMQVRSFLNYEEAYIYMHRLFNNSDMAYKLEGLKCFIISEENLKKLNRGLSFADYFDFYDEHFDRVGSLDIGADEPSTLDEPTELPEPADPDEADDGEDDWEDDNFIF